MTDQLIKRLSKELDELDEIIEDREEQMRQSERPDVQEIFLASSQKRKIDVQQALRMAKADRASE